MRKNFLVMAVVRAEWAHSKASKFLSERGKNKFVGYLSAHGSECPQQGKARGRLKIHPSPWTSSKFKVQGKVQGKVRYTLHLG